MKVVLMHDWLVGFRGGERVLEALCEMFPEAPIYTLIHKKDSTSPTIEKHPIISSPLNKIPGIHNHYRKLLPLFPLAAQSLKLPKDVDLIISSSHCVIKGVKKQNKCKHLSYIHSPMRYIYDQFHTYFGPEAPLLQQLGARIFRNYLQNWDIHSNKNVDLMVANSGFVQKRIATFYEASSVIVHPFVELADFQEIQQKEVKKEDYFLVLSAFAPNKRIDLAVEAFNKLGIPLKIIGSGQTESKLRKMAQPHIEFLGNVDRETVLHHLARAKALIFPGVEDFGIVPLEALAAGTPVIAFKEGGVLETLNDDVALFFTEATGDSLTQAILDFKAENFPREKLFQRAQEFSKENFKMKISNLIKGM